MNGNKLFFYFTYLEKKNDYEQNFFYIRYMFYGCSKLTKLPDISKLDIKDTNDISFFFMIANH